MLPFRAIICCRFRQQFVAWCGQALGISRLLGRQNCNPPGRRYYTLRHWNSETNPVVFRVFLTSHLHNIAWFPTNWEIFPKVRESVKVVSQTRFLLGLIYIREDWRLKVWDQTDDDTRRRACRLYRVEWHQLLSPFCPPTSGFVAMCDRHARRSLEIVLSALFTRQMKNKRNSWLAKVTKKLQYVAEPTYRHLLILLLFIPHYHRPPNAKTKLFHWSRCVYFARHRLYSDQFWVHSLIRCQSIAFAVDLFTERPPYKQAIPFSIADYWVY